MTARSVLVLGGTGVFGARLVQGILATTDLHVIIGSRHIHRLAPTARMTQLAIDTTTLTPHQLKSTGAFAVIDAAGPFQGRDFRVAQAAIAARLHYIDLADGRDFVGAICALDQDARAAGVAVVSGASSTPALSNAVLDRITRGWRQVDDVSIAIMPGNRAPRGLSVMRAILSYVGQPVRVFLGGAWTARPGWSLTRRLRVAGLGRRWVSLCETPDLDIVAARFGVRRSVVFRAGLELPWLHLGLAAAGLLVRAGLVRSLAPWAGLFLRAANLIGRGGTDRGGMVVTARGTDAAGQCVATTWTLLAGAGDGPSIPTLPALAMLRALGGGLAWRGAGPCVGLLTLPQIEREFAGLEITTAIETTTAEDVFPAVLGPRFTGLAAPVRASHRPGSGLVMDGRAQVDGSTSWLAAIAARAFSLPRGGADVPVTIRIDRTAAGELWTRDFAGRRFRSSMRIGRAPGVLEERFGPFRFDLTHAVTGGRVQFGIQGWRFLRLPLPLWLSPQCRAIEDADARGRLFFDVSIDLPFGWGRLVRYRGWLRPVTACTPTVRQLAEALPQAA